MHLTKYKKEIFRPHIVNIANVLLNTEKVARARLEQKGRAVEQKNYSLKKLQAKAEKPNLDKQCKK